VSFFTASVALSTVFLVAALARSILPSRFRFLSPVTSPTASFSRPLISSPLCSLIVLAPFGKTHCPFGNLYPDCLIEHHHLVRFGQPSGREGYEPSVEVRRES